MKAIGYLAGLCLLLLIACHAPSPEKTATFKVWGNCETCKHTIETAARMTGVQEAEWNVDSKLITVKFDTAKVSLDMIEQNIAKAGYDNDKYFGDDYAYGKLKECCQYERKPYEMN